MNTKTSITHIVPVDTQYLSHKKLALTMGIKAARHDILLFTEADCRPIGPKWIKAMAGSYNPRNGHYFGFLCVSAYKRVSCKLIAYDNLTNGLQMISSALSHHPFTGNGRNLSYRKKLVLCPQRLTLDPQPSRRSRRSVHQ